MKTTVETTDLYLEELGQLFKDYEECKATVVNNNLQELVEKEAEIKLRIVGYLKMYPFPESEAHSRIEELEEALKLALREINAGYSLAGIDNEKRGRGPGGIRGKIESLLKQD